VDSVLRIVEPLLTFKNSKDEIEGVKYENLNVVFINAFKEQQAQIDELRKMVKTQQELLKQQAQQSDSLKKTRFALTGPVDRGFGASPK